MLNPGTQQRLVTDAQSAGLGESLGGPFLFFALESLRGKFRRGTGLGCGIDVASGTRDAVAGGADARAVFQQVLAQLRTVLCFNCASPELQVDRLHFGLLCHHSLDPELGSSDGGSGGHLLEVLGVGWWRCCWECELVGLFGVLICDRAVRQFIKSVI
jgi:hypothetical protein